MVYNVCDVVSFATINYRIQNMNTKYSASDEVHLIRLCESFKFNFCLVRETQKLHRISVVYAEVRSNI
jgi:hypothetical protein